MEISLQEVCTKFLGNADLDINLDDRSGVLRLRFSVGEEQSIDFYCEDLWCINIAKHPEEYGCIFVGETNVTIIEDETSIRNEIMKDKWQSLGKTEIKPVALIKIEGGAMINILCEKLSFSMSNGYSRCVLPAN